MKRLGDGIDSFAPGLKLLGLRELKALSLNNSVDMIGPSKPVHSYNSGGWG
jgi:hypothetical protein